MVPISASCMKSTRRGFGSEDGLPNPRNRCNLSIAVSRKHSGTPIQKSTHRIVFGSILEEPECTRPEPRRRFRRMIAAIRLHADTLSEVSSEAVTHSGLRGGDDRPGRNRESDLRAGRSTAKRGWVPARSGQIPRMRSSETQKLQSAAYG